MDIPKETIIVGLGELQVSASADTVLVSVGLGSCVAVCAYDPVAHVGGLAHIVLPSSSQGRRSSPEAKFADRAVPMLFAKMEELEATTSRLLVKLTGGAQMLNGLTPNDRQHIGERNVEAARAAIRACGASLEREDTGGQQGRTARLHVDTGRLVISLIGGDDYEL